MQSRQNECAQGIVAGSSSSCTQIEHVYSASTASALRRTSAAAAEDAAAVAAAVAAATAAASSTAACKRAFATAFAIASACEMTAGSAADSSRARFIGSLRRSNISKEKEPLRTEDKD